MNINIREETVADRRQVEELVRDAFWNLYVPGCDEHYLVHAMRSSSDYVPELSRVVELDGRLVGCIMYTRSQLTAADGERLSCLTFGPVCVHPDYQRRGVGGALIRASIEQVRESGCPAILIYGDPHNYVRFGFQSCVRHRVKNQAGVHPCGLLVLELQPGVLAARQWTFSESDLFAAVDPAAVEQFDADFPPRPRLTAPSQELFYILSNSVVRPPDDQ